MGTKTLRNMPNGPKTYIWAHFWHFWKKSFFFIFWFFGDFWISSFFLKMAFPLFRRHPFVGGCLSWDLEIQISKIWIIFFLFELLRNAVFILPDGMVTHFWHLGIDILYISILAKHVFWPIFNSYFCISLAEIVNQDFGRFSRINDLKSPKNVENGSQTYSKHHFGRFWRKKKKITFLQKHVFGISRFFWKMLKPLFQRQKNFMVFQWKWKYMDLSKMGPENP